MFARIPLHALSRDACSELSRFCFPVCSNRWLWTSLDDRNWIRQCLTRPNTPRWGLCNGSNVNIEHGSPLRGQSLCTGSQTKAILPGNARKVSSIAASALSASSSSSIFSSPLQQSLLIFPILFAFQWWPTVYHSGFSALHLILKTDCSPHVRCYLYASWQIEDIFLDAETSRRYEITSGKHLQTCPPFKDTSNRV